MTYFQRKYFQIEKELRRSSRDKSPVCFCFKPVSIASLFINFIYKPTIVEFIVEMKEAQCTCLGLNLLTLDFTVLSRDAAAVTSVTYKNKD